jgi:hypothetical protein
MEKSRIELASRSHSSEPFHQSARSARAPVESTRCECRCIRTSRRSRRAHFLLVHQVNTEKMLFKARGSPTDSPPKPPTSRSPHAG